MGDRLVCADCGTEAVHGACPDETCRRGRRPGPLRSWLADRCLKDAAIICAHSQPKET